MNHIMVTYSLALLVGLFLGLTGGGGSILTVPILVYIAGIAPVEATGYSLFIVGITSLVGMVGYYRKKLVDVRLALFFSIPSMVSVWLVRHFVIHNLPEVLLQIKEFSVTKDMALILFFAIVMIISSLRMMSLGNVEQKVVKKTNNKVSVAGGVIVGILSGLIGAGGGFLIVPAITLYMGLPLHMAVGTSLLIISLNSLVGFTGDFAHLEEINWPYLLEFSLLSVLGVIIGVYIGKLMDAEKLKKVFAWFVMAVAIIMIVNFIR